MFQTVDNKQCRAVIEERPTNVSSLLGARPTDQQSSNSKRHPRFQGKKPERVLWAGVEQQGPVNLGLSTDLSTLR